MIFSENRTNRVVSVRPTVSKTGAPNTYSAKNTATLQENMFSRLQNATKCKSCGK